MDAVQQAGRIVDWLRERVAAAGSQGFVLGLSGGVDSAVVAGLAVRAMPGKVYPYILPCHSQPEDARLAREVAAAFGLEAEQIVLDEPYDVLRRAYGAGGAPAAGDLADANLKSRLRMITLYYQANRRNCLVLGTGNRSEIAVGYFTKWGDGAVDLLPLAGLVKREVYALARHLGVPQAVIDRPPSGGLWPGQTDEAEMGLRYADIDEYLLTGNVPADIAARIARRIAANEHKRRMPLSPE
ncbi:MAG: NAD(+) synthase [Chloroflexota bacterium]